MEHFVVDRLRETLQDRLAIWEDPELDDAHVIWARLTAERLAVGSLTGAGYANYAPVDETIERVRLAFGKERFARLAAIKARYDPGNLFRFNQNIAPG
jgi:FAD/FMN-containing dehydrogenase